MSAAQKSGQLPTGTKVTGPATVIDRLVGKSEPAPKVAAKKAAAKQDSK